MVSIRILALAASTIVGITSAAPTETARSATYVPGTQNRTQEFYLTMRVTDGDTKYNGYQLEAYHTGAGLADPVFVKAPGSRMFLNGTNLQFDVNQYPFSVNAFPSDDNYARWEPVTITSGYGTGYFVNQGSAGIQVNQEEHDGWIVCEWYHGANAPQLFQMIKGFDSSPGLSAYDVPSSCARVLLFPTYI